MSKKDIYFRKHPIFFMIKVISFFLVLGILFLILFVMVSFFKIDQSFISVSLIFFINIFLMVFVRIFLAWRIDSVFIKGDKIIILNFESLFSYTHQARLLNQLKSVDLKRKGVFEYVFDCGDIHLSSILTGGNSSVGIVLKKMWKAKAFYNFLNQKIKNFS